MTKRTAPTLALVLALVLAATGPAFATKGVSKIPEIITVSEVTVRAEDDLTEIVLHGDYPLNYLVYQPDRNKLVIEVRDCDASEMEPPALGTSGQVLTFEAETENDPVNGSPVSKFEFLLAPHVSHAIDPDGNDLVFRFVGGLTTSDEIPGVTVAPAPAAAVVPARAVNPAPSSDLIGYKRTDISEYVEQAGVHGLPPARALVGVDTSRADSGRVLLMLDGPTSFSTFELTDPARLVVDFESVTNEIPSSSIDVTSPFLDRLRVSQFKEQPDRVARAVLDLSGPSAYEVFPTESGVEILLGPAPLPAPSDLEIADADTGSDASVALEAAPAPEAPVETVARIEDAPALAEPENTEIPEENPSLVGALLAEDTEALNADDYAFYSYADPDAAGSMDAGKTFASKKISDDRPVYTGRRISLELVDADLKQIFRLFHEISGLNFVLDPSVDGQVTIVLDNVPWDQALDIILRNNGLDKVFDNNVMRIATTAKLAAEAQQRRALKDAARLEQDPVTVSRTLSYAKADEIDQIVSRMLQSSTGGGANNSRSRSFFDERTNTIVYTGVPEQVAEITALIDELDARTPQVMIEARIVETSREFVRDLGITWNLLVDDTTGSPNGFGTFTYDVNLPAQGLTNLGIAFGDFGPTAATLDLTIDALELEGHARTLSAPKVAAQNNSTAVIEQGTQIPVVNTTATEINVEFISASLKLEVTPQITAEGTIIMDINVDNSSPDFDNTVGDTPSINTERAATRVLVEDGGTTVIGGVFLLQEGESETGVPGLRKIPGLGWLFKRKNITKQNRELLIFITPKIMS